MMMGDGSLDLGGLKPQRVIGSNGEGTDRLQPTLK